MNPLQTTLHCPADKGAVLTLQQPLTREMLASVELSLRQTLAMLRRDLGDEDDAGAIEVASWAQYLRPAAA